MIIFIKLMDIFLTPSKGCAHTQVQVTEMNADITAIIEKNIEEFKEQYEPDEDTLGAIQALLEEAMKQFIEQHSKTETKKVLTELHKVQSKVQAASKKSGGGNAWAQYQKERNLEAQEAGEKYDGAQVLADYRNLSEDVKTELKARAKPLETSKVRKGSVYTLVQKYVSEQLKERNLSKEYQTVIKSVWTKKCGKPWDKAKQEVDQFIAENYQ